MARAECFVGLTQTKADLSARYSLHMNPSTHVAWHLPLGHSALHQWPVFFCDTQAASFRAGTGHVQNAVTLHGVHRWGNAFSMLSWGHSSNDLKWRRLAGCVWDLSDLMHGWMVCLLLQNTMKPQIALTAFMTRQHAAPNFWLISNIHLRACETKTSQCSKWTDK